MIDEDVKTLQRVVPATTIVERHYKASVARVFRAWSDPKQFAQWCAPGEDWVLVDSEVDFRIHGRQMFFFGPPGAPRFKGDGRFEDIIENHRIVTAGTMHDMEEPDGHQRMSTTICIVEFLEEKGGTRLILTDHSVFYTWETPADRKEGWGEILAKLDAYLKGKN
jgi:uncharacterized protein YndB with AHSA1/START domain